MSDDFIKRLIGIKADYPPRPSENPLPPDWLGGSWLEAPGTDEEGSRPELSNELSADGVKATPNWDDDDPVGDAQSHERHYGRGQPPNAEVMDDLAYDDVHYYSPFWDSMEELLGDDKSHDNWNDPDPNDIVQRKGIDDLLSLTAEQAEALYARERAGQGTTTPRRLTDAELRAFHHTNLAPLGSMDQLFDAELTYAPEPLEQYNPHHPTVIEEVAGDFMRDDSGKKAMSSGERQDRDKQRAVVRAEERGTMRPNSHEVEQQRRQLDRQQDAQSGSKTIAEASQFLKSLAFEKAFGDKHRETARKHCLALADMLFPSMESQEELINDTGSVFGDLEGESKSIHSSDDEQGPSSEVGDAVESMYPDYVQQFEHPQRERQRRMDNRVNQARHDIEEAENKDFIPPDWRPRTGEAINVEIDEYDTEGPREGFYRGNEPSFHSQHETAHHFSVNDPVEGWLDDAAFDSDPGFIIQEGHEHPTGSSISQVAAGYQSGHEGILADAARDDGYDDTVARRIQDNPGYARYVARRNAPKSLNNRKKSLDQLIDDLDRSDAILLELTALSGALHQALGAS